MRSIARVRWIIMFAAAFAAIGAGALWAEFSQSTPVVGDLSAPRGLAVAPNGDLVVSEQGVGRIWQIDDAGNATALVEGIAAAADGAGPEGTDAAGVSAARFVGDTLYYITGEFDADGEAGFQTLYRLTPEGESEVVADFFAYEQENNTDGETEPLELLSNPYDLIAAPQGGVLVSDAGANAVLHVDEDGTITPFAIFTQRPNPLPFGPPLMDQVPTGMTVGPDGAAYVSTLTGFPFPSGEGRVYRLEDLNDDGDALDDGEVTVFASGLTTATDIAFDTDGSLLVTEFSTDMLEEAPGRLVRVRDGALSTVAQLITPTAVLVKDGRIFVSQEFIGLVSEITVLPTETLALPAGGDYVAWVFGDTTAAEVFGGVKAAWKWENGAWVAWIPQLGITDFEIPYASVLFVVLEAAGEIEVPGR